MIPISSPGRRQFEKPKEEKKVDCVDLLAH
jgi:hypothetical protein